MSAMTTVKSMQVPKWDGEAKKFQLWWTRFMAFAVVCKFAPAMKATMEADMPSSEDDTIVTGTPDGDRQMAAKERNFAAIAQLTMAFTSETAMTYIYEGMTNADWPSGLAYLVVVALRKKHLPDDTIAKVEMRRALNSVRMKKSDDPVTLFNQLAAVKVKYNKPAHPIADDVLIPVVIAEAPDLYQGVLTSEQLRKGTALKLDDLALAMDMQWRAMGGTSTGKDDSSEIALVSFAGTCFLCKQKGHKSFQCPTKKSGSNNNSNGGNRGSKLHCKHCNKDGHLESKCWMKPGNEHLKPQWLRNKESSSAAVGSNSSVSCEILLCSLTFPATQKILDDPNVWIGDTGASTHSTPHSEGLRELKNPTASDSITMGNGKSESASKIGTLTGTICDKHGNQQTTAKVQDVTYLPGGKYNLFSLSKMQLQGWRLNGDANRIWLTKGETKISFDLKIETPKGAIFAMYLNRNTEVANPNVARPANTLSIKQAHAKYGHLNEDETRKTAKYLDVPISRGTLGPCNACTLAKAKQKNVPKHSEHKEANQSDGRRIFLDQSSIKPNKEGWKSPKPVWRMIVDEQSTLKVSHFYETKKAMVEPTCELLQRWKSVGKAVKYLRMDNAGENKALELRADSKDWKLNLTYEYTARDTPQQNHLVELGLADIANKGRATMIAANVPLKTRYLLFHKAFGFATDVDGLKVVTKNGVTKTRYEHFCGTNPKWVPYMRTWGEAGTVKIKTKATPKIADRGIQCMFVGYAKNHEGDCFEMWNPKTGRVHVTRDVIWLRRMYFHVAVTEAPMEGADDVEVVDTQRNRAPAATIRAGESVGSAPDAASNATTEDGNNDAEDGNNDANTTETPQSNGTSTSGDEPSSGSITTEEIDDPDDILADYDDAQPTVRTASGRAVNTPAHYADNAYSAIEEPYGISEDADTIKWMQEISAAATQADLYEMGLTDAEKHFYSAMAEYEPGTYPENPQDACELTAVGAGIGGGFENTSELRVMKYREAMNGADKDKWKTAVEDEHNRMLKYGVWEAVRRRDLTGAAKIITSTWAMKKKASGRYRARLNARGFEQREGLHYDGSSISAPVSSEIVIRVVLVLMIMAGWIGEILDVQGAFLH